MRNLPVPAGVIQKLFRAQRFVHFFVPTPHGFMEVRGATIHPTADAERKTQPRGYFFVGRLWSKSYLQELGTLIDGQVSLRPVGLLVQGQVSEPASSAVAFSTTLMGWSDAPIALVSVRALSPVLREVRVSSGRQFLLLAAFSLLVLLLPSLLIAQWVSQPLQKLLASLEKKDAAPLDALRQNRTEFGHLARLMREFFEQTELMQEAKLEAEHTSRAKSDYLSRMSHELRTPLNAILGFAQLLEMDSLSAEQQESVAHILRGGQHLLALVNDVLDITRIESGRLTISPEPVQVSAVVRGALELIGPLAAKRELRLDDSAVSDVYILADLQRFKQVLLNLLSNAVKYNRRGGTVTVSSEDVAGDRLRIKVTDTGLGVRPERLSQLFIPFARLEADQTGVEGSGVGLAVAKGLVELMGGHRCGKRRGREEHVLGGSSPSAESSGTTPPAAPHTSRRPA